MPTIGEPALRPRRVTFDWESTPLHWIPGDPATTHLINSLSLLLPAGERWFVKVFKEALPYITDEELRQRAKGFMGQEAVHSYSHAGVLDHLKAQGLKTEGFTKHVEWMFFRLLGDEPPLPVPKAEWLRFRLALIAAIEHFTCILGDWILHADELDAAGADAVMLDLLRWHGAEEVEHRSVAFDIYQHLGGRYSRYPRRVEGMVFAFPVLIWLLIRGTSYLVERDPTLTLRRYRLREHARAVRMYRAPGWGVMLAAVPRYLRPGYHPSQEGDLAKALAYLMESPAALAVSGEG